MSIYEIAANLTSTAIENNVINFGKDKADNIENAEQITEFYKTIFKALSSIDE